MHRRIEIAQRSPRSSAGLRRRRARCRAATRPAAATAPRPLRRARGDCRRRTREPGATCAAACRRVTHLRERQQPRRPKPENPPPSGAANHASTLPLRCLECIMPHASLAWFHMRPISGQSAQLICLLAGLLLLRRLAAAPAWHWRPARRWVHGIRRAAGGHCCCTTARSASPPPAMTATNTLPPAPDRGADRRACGPAVHERGSALPGARDPRAAR